MWKSCTQRITAQEMWSKQRIPKKYQEIKIWLCMSNTWEEMCEEGGFHQYHEGNQQAMLTDHKKPQDANWTHSAFFNCSYFHGARSLGKSYKEYKRYLRHLNTNWMCVCVCVLMASQTCLYCSVKMKQKKNINCL